MMKILRITGVLMVLTMVNSPTMAQYCTPSHANLCEPWITRVQFASIDNANTDCGNGAGYSDFSAMVTDLVVGEVYTLTVSLSGTAILDEGAVWFDWDGNGFDPTEIIILTGQGDFADLVGIITVPPTAVTGITSRFRIRTEWPAPPEDPCAQMTFGESEDYSFFIPDPLLPQCAENLAPDAVDQCQNVTLTWDAASAGEPATGYRVYLGTGGTYDIVPGDTTLTTSFTVPTLLAPGTPHNWYVVPFNDAGNAAGCDSPIFFNTHNNANPTVDILETQSTTCVNENDTLIVTVQNGNGDPNLFEYTWSGIILGNLNDPFNDTTVFNTMDQGTYWYFVDVQDENGCAGNRDSIEVVVNASPSGSITGQNTLCEGNDLLLTLTGSGQASIVWEVSSDDVVFAAIPNETDVDLVTSQGAGVQYYRAVLTENGCTFTTPSFQVEVVANPDAPTVDAIGPVGEPFGLCIGATATLNVSNFTSDIVWSTGETTSSIEIGSAGTYTATYTDGNGCSSDSVVVVTPLLLPDAPELSPTGTVTVCPGLTGRIDVLNYTDNLLWNNNETSTTLVVTQSGDYFVTYTDDNGCAAQSETVTVDILTVVEPPLVEAPNGPDFCPNVESFLVVTNYVSGISWNDANATQNDTLFVQDAGTYTATFSGDGCSAQSDPFTVSFHPAIENPNIEVSPANGLCTDSLVTLEVMNYPKAQWNDPGMSFERSIQVGTSGNYRAEITDGNDCVYSSEVDLTFLPTPDPVEIFFANDSLFIQDPTATSYVWFFNGAEVAGENNPFISNLQDGEYVAYGVNGDCWGAGASFTYPPIGISENGVDKVSIFPNPAQHVVHLQNYPDHSSLEIISIEGRIIAPSMPLTGAEKLISLSHLNDGVYFLRIHSPQGSRSYRLIVN